MKDPQSGATPRLHSRSAGGLAGLVGLGLLLAGCADGGQQAAGPQGPVVRSAIETAPADLQLLCAAEAAKVYSAPSEKVLPLSSARSSPTTFDVELDVAGKRARCTVDETGATITVVDA